MEDVLLLVANSDKWWNLSLRVLIQYQTVVEGWLERVY